MNNSANPKNRWFSKLAKGLSKSAGTFGGNLYSIMHNSKIDEKLLEDIEDLLLMSDFGVGASERLKNKIARIGSAKSSEDDIKDIIYKEIKEILKPLAKPIEINSSYLPHVILVAGVNGVGKTTTIGKLAYNFSKEKNKIILAAADTFRAAAVEQLKVWGQRANAEVIYKEIGTDSAALAFEALEIAKKNKADILIIDTAGRLQNKSDLMAQLEKIPRVLKKIDPTAPHSALLVLDATTGQNVHSQVDLFRKACSITGLIMTKLDGTARGGVLVSIAEKFSLPIHAIGVGEDVDDLQPFEADLFAKALLGLKGNL
tara:strand:+ start:1464 stop:2408 length:945 start_codon:yes stop_codon:yes gene_type:complete